MKSEFKNLVKDVVSYVKEGSPLFFEDRFLLSFRPKKTSSFQKPSKTLPKKPVEQPVIKPNVQVPKRPVEIVQKPEITEKEQKEPEFIEKKPKEVVLKEEKPKKEKQSFLDNSLDTSVKFELFESIKKQVKDIDPHFALTKEILDDLKAKKIANKWKYKLNAYPVVILTSLKEGDELEFLKSLAKAIEVYFFEARVVLIDTIEKDNQWEEFLKSENIRLLIAVDDQIWSFKNLMSYFKEIPNKSLKTLMDKPLFLIPNIKLYFQNFLLKKSLWKALCQTITNL